MLFPRMSESRKAISLNGIWDFCLLSKKEASTLDASAKLQAARMMPVPSSYNDIYETREFRDHMGDMAYQTELFLTPDLLEERLMLRFESVAHFATVYMNGVLLGTHKGGFLPFEFCLNSFAQPGKNRLTVVANNVTDYTTLPCGRVEVCEYPNIGAVERNFPNFDFFNYTGILRPVWLYTTPKTYIQDITVYGKINGDFHWQVKTNAPDSAVTVHLLDAQGEVVSMQTGCIGSATIENAQLWDTKNPYLYTLRVLCGKDVYEEPFGFREITVDNCRLYLNGERLYLKGFGKHEDSPVYGRGFNPAYSVKDLSLLHWIGANSFRTSHYPVSEEMLQMCDRAGILIVDESPAVGLNTGFTAVGLLGGDAVGTWKTIQTQEHHAQVVRDYIARDKNHPCVIMWSIANEPATQEEGAGEYFAPLMQLARELDPQARPRTVVSYDGANAQTCKVSELCDVLVINRYRGWYDTEGNLPAAKEILREELLAFHERYPDKPVFLGEYGADTIAGMHNTTPSLFSEEYQVEFLRAYSEVFDSLDFITGEHVWNFADFATAENIKRVQGNRKGVFTRERHPKMAAFFLKERWNNFEKK